MRHKTAETYPTFSGDDFVSAMIMGESNDLGRNPSSHAEAKPVIISAKHERFLGESSEGVPDFRIGRTMGDFPQLISKWGVGRFSHEY